MESAASTTWHQLIGIAPGSLIAGRYEVIDELGAGGMGFVLKVIDHRLNDEVVALKLLNPHFLARDKSAFKRFVNEVLVARSLSHPNIVRIHDIGETQSGSSYISMEYVEGYSLRDKLDAGIKREEDDNTPGLQLDLKEACSILYQILNGIAYAHGRGIIHRDLKPANALISKDGEIKIADFGTARFVGVDSGITQTGQVLGTPDYMAPELIMGESPDHLCDIYSLGIMGFELVEGIRPFTADNTVAIAFKHCSSPLPAFTRPESEVPLWYQQIVHKATEKIKKDRFQSAEEFISTLLTNMPEVGQHSSRIIAVSKTAPRRRKKTIPGEWELGPEAEEEAEAEKIASIAVEPSSKYKSPGMRIAFFFGSLLGLFTLSIILFRAAGINRAPDDSAQKQLATYREEALKVLEQELVANIQTQPLIAKEKVKESVAAKQEPEAIIDRTITKALEGTPLEKPKQEPPKKSIEEKAPATESIEIAKKTEPIKGEQDLLSGTRDFYQGEFIVLQGDSEKSRGLSLEVGFAGGNISGSATIDGYGNFRVSGKELPRGVEMTLKSDSLEIRLSGNKTANILRGTYSIPLQNKQGRWKATLLE